MGFPEDLYRSCALCPRNCGVDRTGRGRNGGRGFCGEGAPLRLASAVIHRGEEPPISGRGGSGAVFITGCNLGCGFCQNRGISAGGIGRAVEAEEFVRICLALEKKGAENINLVTGSHAVPALASGIDAARRGGLSIPVLWNTSSYESRTAMEILKDRIDMYLPDLKTLDRDIAARLFGTPDYGGYAAAAILDMMEYRPRRVIIRHLVLPGYPESTREVLRWFAEHVRGRAYLSLMTQYTPPPGIGSFPSRRLSREEYETALGWLEEFDIEDGFYQEFQEEGGSIPDFSRQNPFADASSGDTPLAEAVWHWKDGFN